MTTGKSEDKTIFMGSPAQMPAGVAVPNPGGRIKSDTQFGAPPAAAGPVGEGLAADTRMPVGTNPIVGCSTTLIAVLTGLRNAVSAPNVVKLQEDLVAEIKQCEANMRASGAKEDAVQVARYILCTAMDEAILSTPWGADSGWGQRSLLRIFHKETSGGEKFFALLNGVKARQGEFRDLLELFYILLTLGFKGRFQIDPQGNEKIDQIREELFVNLYSAQSFNRSLSPHWQSNAPRDPKMLQVIPLWVMLSIVMAITLAVFTGLRVWLHSDTADIATRFENIIKTDDSN